MFGSHFYHGILRKSVSIFGTVFNNINIMRKSGSESIITSVPLAYGPKQKFLARIDQQADLTDQKVAIKLPRMSFEITSVEYNNQIKTSKVQRLRLSDDGEEADTIGNVPYIIGMQLNILAKSQDDALQILEQILPTFEPTYSVSAKLIDGVENSFDVPITLQSVTINDDYESDFQTRRVIMYTLDFTMRVHFFGQVVKSKIIKDTLVNYRKNIDSYLQGVSQVVDPISSSSSDDYSVVKTFNYIAPENFISAVVSGTVGVTDNEVVIGADSAVGGRIESITYDEQADETTVVINNLDGYFTVGETLTGSTSGQTFVINEYTVS